MYVNGIVKIGTHTHTHMYIVHPLSLTVLQNLFIRYIIDNRIVKCMRRILNHTFVEFQRKHSHFLHIEEMKKSGREEEAEILNERNVRSGVFIPSIGHWNVHLLRIIEK